MARAKTMSTRKIYSLPSSLLKRVDDYRYSNRLPTEADAVRELIRNGLLYGRIMEEITRCVDEGLIPESTAKEILRATTWDQWVDETETANLPKLPGLE